MKKWIAAVLLALWVLMLSGCDDYSSSNSSSSSSSYSGKSAAERYDEKYGKGSYAADKQLIEDMRDAWNSMTGN